MLEGDNKEGSSIEKALGWMCGGGKVDERVHISDVDKGDYLPIHGRIDGR